MTLNMGLFLLAVFLAGLLLIGYALRNPPTHNKEKPVTQSVKTGHPVSEVPIEGFGTQSKFATEKWFRDETVEERDQWERENGYYPDTCDAEFMFGENRGACTRPEGHFLNGDNGMHLAGNGQYIHGAW